MSRRLLVAVAATSLMSFAVPGPADASPTTNTRHQHKVIEHFVDEVPSCGGGGPSYHITTTSNSTQHVTKFRDGRRHIRFTSTGRFVAKPVNQAHAPAYTGHFTITGGFNRNTQSINGNFIFNLHGTGSNGSRASAHLMYHFNEPPDGTVKDFFRCH